MRATDDEGQTSDRTFNITVTYVHVVENSLRFNDDDNAYLSRTPSSAGNRKTWTWSGWVKRGVLGTNQAIFGVGAESNYYYPHCAFIQFNSNDFLEVQFRFHPNYYYYVLSYGMFRDCSSWIHIMVSMDTTLTTSDRIKLYINGELSTGSSSQPPQNYESHIMRNVVHHMGLRSDLNNPSYKDFLVDCLLAEVNFIDGQALTPSNFGETDATYGHWKPIEYTGTYGTNGFYLDFADSGSIGNDVSGNNNDWTPTNLAATDQMLDSPTNNFATQNPLHIHTDGSPTFSEGNLRIVTALTPAGRNVSTMGVTSGKYYAEMYHEAGVSGQWVAPRTVVGITTNAVDTIRARDGGNIGHLSSSEDVGYYGDGGNKNVAGSNASYGASWTIGDIIGVALNMDDNEVTFYKNNASQGTISFTAGGEGHFACGDTSGGGGLTAVWNYGQDSSFAGNKTAQSNTDSNGVGDFYYEPPEGFLALCTDNLPCPTVEPSEHFGVVTYNGNGTDNHQITGVGFQSDLAWIKHRQDARSHAIADSVRGVTKYLTSNSTVAEITDTDGIASFDTDGFTLDANTSGSIMYRVNESGGTPQHVAWLWKMGGTGVSNTDGSITSTVSANVAAGQSIVSYTGTASNATVGHGLNSAPELIIAKNRIDALNWLVYHKDIAATQRLFLNKTDAVSTSSTPWNDTEPTDTVISLSTSGYTNGYGDNMIAYCFHSVDGYSKVGSYTGNGSADGTFVYTGFRPAYVLGKRTNASGNEWFMFDANRDVDNGVNHYLYASASDAEGSTPERLDFLSNGFKWKNTAAAWNASGGTYIYIAFAEYPFKYTNAR